MSYLEDQSIVWRIVLVGLLGLFMAAGCTTTDNVTEVHAEGVGARMDPSLGMVELGYISVGYYRASLKAGQGTMIIRDQYGLSSSNLLSRQVYCVMPQCDSDVTVKEVHRSLMSFLGFSIPLPYSPQHTEVEVTKKEPSK